MARTCIAICTCERPEGLAALLAALDRQRLASLDPEEVEIVVVDNGPGAEAAAVCAAYAVSGRFRLTARHEPQRGLTFARNRALREAQALGARWAALVDDDEMPAPDWLEGLAETMRATGAAACVGPVVPVFAAPPPAWAAAGGYFAKRLPVRDGLVADAYTANAMIDLAVVAELGLSFDLRFNLLGGEDTYFFLALLRAGHRIAWAEGALVYDAIPERRMRPAWLLARWYRTGSIDAHLGRYPVEGAAGRVVSGLRGLARLGGGGLRLLAALGLRRRPLIGSAFTLCRGAGLIAAALGHGYREYDPVRYGRETAPVNVRPAAP
ncbi:glycosyltransferase family 2 protein [Methylobacterium sp. A54F]